MATDRFAHDRFLIEQLIRPMVNLYQVTPLATGETPAGGPVAFVRQKRMAIKEDIRFYANEQETEELFRIKARALLDIGGRYNVTEPDGTPIGILEHQFGKSLLRSTWRIMEPDETEIATALERNKWMALARRVVDFVPYVGEFVPIPYNFDLLMDGKPIGHMNRKFQLRDRYVLDVSGDEERRLDRRLAIALAIGLDALQNR
jgi:uncharacterized protein YxjI